MFLVVEIMPAAEMVRGCTDGGKVGEQSEKWEEAILVDRCHCSGMSTFALDQVDCQQSSSRTVGVLCHAEDCL